MSRRVSFSPEESIFSVEVVGSNKTRATPKLWVFKGSSSSSRFSLGSFFRNIGAKVSNALPMFSTRRKCSGKVSSSASLARSRSYAEALDSHRAEAIEDCIEFLNNPSLQRSSSVNSSC